MPFDAVKCTISFSDNIYTVNMTVRYLDAGGNVLAQKPISAKVDKADGPTMRGQLQVKLQPLLDQAVLELPDEVNGKTNISTQILTQVNTYLSTKG
jgi:hypothetical protein